MRYLLFLVMVFGLNVIFANDKNIIYEYKDKKYQGYFIDKGKNAPLVFLIHDWDGLNEYEIKRSNMIASLGYSVLALDLYGKDTRPNSIKENKKFSRELYKDRAKMRGIMNSALKVAKNKMANVDNAVAIGYCFGGSATLELARSGVDLKGFVTFHGGLATPKAQNYSKTKGSVLILHGSADSSVKMKDFASLANRLEKNKIKHEMITYSGAPHAFSVFGSKRYTKDADEKSWKRFIDYLENTLK